MEAKNVSKDDLKDDQGIEETNSMSQFDVKKKEEAIKKEEAMETEEAIQKAKAKEKEEAIQKAKAMEKGKAVCYDEETEEKKSMALNKLLQDAMKDIEKVAAFMMEEARKKMKNFEKAKAMEKEEAIQKAKAMEKGKSICYDEENKSIPSKKLLQDAMKGYIYPRSLVDVKSNIMFSSHHQENSQDDIEIIKDYLYSSDDSVTGLEKSKHDEDNAVQVEVEQPELPIGFERKISQLGGVDVEFVIEKKLSESDVEKPNPRLTMQSKECKVDLDFIGNRQVKVIQPSANRNRKVLSFKNEGGSYVFDGNSWSEFVDKNDLKAGDVIQVWKFRQGNEVCFALVKPINKG